MLSVFASPLTATPTIFALACLAVLAGAVVQGASGVGLGLVAAPVLIFIDPHIGPGPMLVLALLTSALMLTRERGGIDRYGLGMTLSGRAVGSIIAGFAYAWLSGSSYALIFGILILIGVGMSVAGYEMPRTPGRLIFAGVCSGIMGTLTSAGSPAIALVYHKAGGDVVRSTLAAFFFVSSALSLAILFATGKFTLQQALASLLLVPAMLVGVWLSGHVIRHASSATTRLVVLCVSAGSAAVLIVKALVELA